MDDDKIKPVRGSDVSINCGPHVKGYDNLERWLAVATKRFGYLDSLHCCGECIRGTLRSGLSMRKIESRSSPINFRIFATVIGDSLRLYINKMVLAQGLGDEDCQAPRDEEGDRR